MEAVRGGNALRRIALALIALEITSLMLAMWYSVNSMHPSVWVLAALGVFIPGSASITLMLMILLSVLRETRRRQ